MSAAADVNCSTPEATACSAVLEWQQGRMTSDEVAEIIYDLTGGAEAEAKRLMLVACDWYARLVTIAKASQR